MEFSEKLRKVREILGLSQENLARELGVSFATINRIEKGKSLPCYNTAKRFEDFCKKNKINLGEKND